MFILHYLSILTGANKIGMLGETRKMEFTACQLESMAATNAFCEK